MSRAVRLLAILLILLLPSFTQAQTKAPDMVGTWVTVKGEVAHWQGGVKDNTGSVGTLIVEEQFGGAFRGTMSWANDRKGPEFEGAAGVQHGQQENIVGIVDWDNVTVYWADHEDETTYRGRLVNATTLEAVAVEAGDHAVAARMIMIRQ